MRETEHRYGAHLVWEGNLGEGTVHYERYGRDYRIEIAGKPPLAGSADAAFRGDAGCHNPEDLLVAALAGCHMLSYLALCARSRISVLAYEDEPRGLLREDGRGGGRFVAVELRPRVTVADPAQVERARALHAKAHELCFIASSVSFPVGHRAEVSA